MYDNEFIDFVDEAFSDVFTEEMTKDEYLQKKMMNKLNSYSNDPMNSNRVSSRGANKARANAEKNHDHSIYGQMGKYDRDASKAVSDRGIKDPGGKIAAKTSWAMEKHEKRHGAKHELASLLGSNF